jgi:hypothetical protein
MTSEHPAIACGPHPTVKGEPQSTVARLLNVDQSTISRPGGVTMRYLFPHAPEPEASRYARAEAPSAPAAQRGPPTCRSRWPLRGEPAAPNPRQHPAQAHFGANVPGRCPFQVGTV